MSVLINVRKTYIDPNIDSSQISYPFSLNSESSSSVSSSGYSKTEADARFVQVSGDTMTGKLIISRPFDTQLDLGYNVSKDPKIEFYYGTTSEAFIQLDHTSGKLIFDYDGTQVSLSDSQLTMDGDIESTSYSTTSGNFSVNSGGDMELGGDASITGNLNVSGETNMYGFLNVEDGIQSMDTFISGMLGSGMKLWKEDNDWHLEVDDFIVRGTFQVYEFIRSKMRFVNGTLIISPGNATATTPSGATYTKAGLYYQSTGTYAGTYYFYTDTENNGLVDDDRIEARAFTGNRLYQYQWNVVKSYGDTIWVEAEEDRNNEGGDQGYGDPNHGLVDIDCYIFDDAVNIPYAGYDITTQPNDSFKTEPFKINGKGNISFHWDADTYASGIWSFQVRDGDGGALSAYDYITLSTSGGEKTAQIVNFPTTGETNYIYFYNSSGSNTYSALGFYIDELTDHTIGGGDELDVTGLDFVVKGHPTDTTRQGGIINSASEPNSPYIRIWDGSTDWDISADQWVWGAGNITGIPFNDITLGGYGNFSKNSFIEGSVVATTGKIGDMTIQNGNLIGDDGNGNTIGIHTAEQQIVLSDSNNIVGVKIINDEIPSLADIQSGGELIYEGSYASQYTDKSDSITTTNGGSETISDYFLGGSSTYVYDYTSAPATGNQFPTSNVGSYKITMKMNVDVDYTVPTSSHMIWGKPAEEPIGGGQLLVTNEYEVIGGWRVVANTYIYDSGGTQLDTASSFTNYGYINGDLDDWVVFDKNVTLDSSTYIKFVPTFYSTIIIKNTQKTWIAEDYGYYPEDEYLAWEQYGETTTTNESVTINYSYEVSELFLNGRVQATVLGNDGIAIYKDSDKYFYFAPWKSGQDDFETAGGWDHKLPSASSFELYEDGYTPSYSGLLNIAGNDGAGLTVKNFNDNSSVPSAFFYNGRDNAAGVLLKFGDSNTTFSSDEASISNDDEDGLIYYGHRLSLKGMSYDTSSSSSNPIYINPSGYSTGDAHIARFYLNSVEYGGIYYDSNQFLLWDNSDEKYKDDVKDVEIDALSKVKQLKYREWTWKKDDGKGKIVKGDKPGKGFVAQEIKDIYPEAVLQGVDPDNPNTMAVSQMALIPLLMKSIQEQQVIIETLQQDIEKLKKK